MGHTEYTICFLKIECAEFHVSTILYVAEISGCSAVLWTYHILFNASPIVGHLCHFQYFAIVIITMIKQSPCLANSGSVLSHQNKP